MTRSTRTYAGAVVAALGLLLTACTGSSTPGPGASASSSATTSGSSSVQSGSIVDKAGFFASLTSTAGQVKTYQADITIETRQDSTVSTSTQKVAVDTTNPAEMHYRMTSTMMGATIEMIIIGNTTYTRMTGSTVWTKSVTSSSQASTVVGTLNQQSSSVTKVTYFGNETVAGVSARHYQMEFAATSSATDKPVSIDLWLDSAGLVIQMRTVMQTGAMTTTMTSVMSHYGEPVSITAPPASQVIG